MNNKEAHIVLFSKRDETQTTVNNINRTQQHLSEYEREMGNWKTDIITAKITAIKSEATAVGVDLSTWDGSAAPVESE